MNFLRKFGDLIDSFDKDDASKDGKALDDASSCKTVCGATEAASEPAMSIGSCRADSCATDLGTEPAMSTGSRAPIEASPLRDDSAPLAENLAANSLHVVASSTVDPPLESLADVDEVEGAGESAEVDGCHHCSELRRKLAARQAACAARDSEAKRQVRQIEALEAALKAEKCRTRVSQGATESAERRTSMLERELSQSKNEISELRSRVTFLERRVESETQQVEEVVSEANQTIENQIDMSHERVAADHVHDPASHSVDNCTVKPRCPSQDEARSSAGGVAVAEISRLKASLREAHAMVEHLKAQQLRLTEGMNAELKLRDADLAFRMAEIASLRGYDLSSNDELEFEISPIREVVFTEPGTLGIEFEEMEAPFVVREVIFGTQAEGRVRTSDHIVDINGNNADLMTWAELVSTMSIRPVTVRVQHIDPRSRSKWPTEALEKQVGAAWGTVCSLTGRAKEITSKAVNVAMSELKVAATSPKERVDINTELVSV